MKINYERTVPITPRLNDVRPGELFRPTNTDSVYLRTNSFGSDDFTSDKEPPLRKLFEDIQSFYDKNEGLDYEALVFCVNVETGKLVLLDSELKVEKLIGELLIKER